jgi:peptidoglycan hydrolase-like protein with peptidoglycan-binding domain
MRFTHVLAGSLVLTALSALPATAQPAGASLAYVQPLPGPAVQSVQERLRQAGIYAGRIDGVWGADSQAALERFQQAHQLQVRRSIPRPSR